ncbi:MAG TPA: TetR/AcrR family transcriptional regulator [Solirubrobacteraceae bacterium]
MSASSPTTRRARRPRAAYLGPKRRRPQILGIALELFLERGYKGTSMDAVAHAAGVTKPVVYDFFKSKAELFGALLDQEEQRMLAQFSTALASGARSGDARTMLVAGFTSMLRAVMDTPGAYRIALLGESDVEAVIDARVRHGRSQQIAATAEVARSWLQGRVPADRLDATSQFVGQTLIGIGEAGVRTMLAAPDDWSPERLCSVLGELAVSGYSALVQITPDPAGSTAGSADGNPSIPSPRRTPSAGGPAKRASSRTAPRARRRTSPPPHSA